MDRTFKVGDKVRFKTREQIKEAATTVLETYINGKLDKYSYDFPSGLSFINRMEYLCGVEAYIADISGDIIKLNKFSKYSSYKDYNWVYTIQMVELVEEDKLAEKKKKIEYLKKQDKISFAIEQLEKVKDIILNERKITSFKFDIFNKGKDTALFWLNEEIDNQINKLKGKVEDE